jgi:hypothetical protein
MSYVLYFFAATGVIAWIDLIYDIVTGKRKFKGWN